MPQARHVNTRKHIHHINTLVHGTIREGKALVGYGSKNLHDAIVHVMESAVKKGVHKDPSIPASQRNMIAHFGNTRINKKNRHQQLQALAIQGGGSWGSFWKGVKHGVQKVFSPQNITTAASVAALLL